jgi:hypothetical protein
VADRSLVARLRASGGPSHDLLVLLDQHRVMTTVQLAHASGVPERTARYRIERLHTAGLVDFARPGRERGSAPRHWWLRPSGARLVAGTAAADGRPSGLFVAHAAAITEVYLALVERGPAAGIEVTGWLTDRAGWQEWTRAGRWSSHPSRLTPDAVGTFSFDGGEAVAFVEVDLASMTQTLLKQKVARYLAYADDLVWQDRYPYCPPMLLLTTTPTRAVSFLRAAGQVIARHRSTTDPQDRAAKLVVAACGLVRDPGQAVTEACWALPDDSMTDLMLADILAERAKADDASDAWLYERDVVQRRRDNIEALRSVARASALADWLGSEHAAEALRVLIGTDPDAFLSQKPDIAERVVDWFDRRRRLGRFQARDLARPLVAEMEERHAVMWQQQAHRLLAAKADIADKHPRLCQLAATLADGHLANEVAVAALDHPAEQTRAQIQQAILGDYSARRATAIEQQWADLGRRDRRRINRDVIEVNYDEHNLCICDTCALVHPLPPNGEITSRRCHHCDGTVLDWLDRTSVKTLALTLDIIRTRHGDAPSVR